MVTAGPYVNIAGSHSKLGEKDKRLALSHIAKWLTASGSNPRNEKRTLQQVRRRSVLVITSPICLSRPEPPAVAIPHITRSPVADQRAFPPSVVISDGAGIGAAWTVDATLPSTVVVANRGCRAFAGEDRPGQQDKADQDCCAYHVAPPTLFVIMSRDTSHGSHL